MAGRFVRASKYRHVFGRSTKKEQCYDNLRISKNAWDTNLVKVNPSYLAINWEASGGGAFAVIPLNERGKLPEQLPLFRGHTAAVLDTDWSPFNDTFIASGSDDGKVMLWRVPQNFTIHQDSENIQDVAPVSKLTGHSRKVGHVLFNPSAENVLASSSGDYTIKLWDVEAESAKLTLKHNDIVQSLSWSANGSLLVTTCRDKKLRVWDVRQEKPALETAGHSGAKNSRAVWMGEKDRIATTGFSKMSDRQLGLWDIRAGKEPIDGFQILDQISGVCMPFWDDGCNCLYLAGKGDGNIRYYEYENDKFEYLAQHSSADPQRGVAFLPKRGVNTHENEVMRAYRTVGDSLVEPVSFIVPRRAEVFQEDIYPPTVGTRPGLSSSDWFSGKESLPPKISLASLYEGNGPEEVPQDYKSPVSAKDIKPSKSTTDEAKATSTAEATPVPRQTMTSIKQSQNSMSDIASKFADTADENDAIEDGDTGDFGEVPEPVKRPGIKSSVEKTNGSTETTKTVSQLASPDPQAPVASAPAVSAGSLPSKPLDKAESEPVSSQSLTSKDAVSDEADSGSIKSNIKDIKNMLLAQQKTNATQAEQIKALMEEVRLLRAQMK